MILLELFNKPYKYKVIDFDTRNFEVIFMDEENFKYKVIIANDSILPIYEVLFYGYDQNGSHATKLLGNKRTSPIRIFSTVASIMHEFAKNNVVKLFYFTADQKEPSRVSLYRRGLPTLARELSMDYTEIASDEMYEIELTLHGDSPEFNRNPSGDNEFVFILYDGQTYTKSQITNHVANILDM